MDNIIIYNTDDGAAKVSLYANDGTVWMTQAQMAELFQSSKQNIGQCLPKERRGQHPKMEAPT